VWVLSSGEGEALFNPDSDVFAPAAIIELQPGRASTLMHFAGLLGGNAPGHKNLSCL
jgi:hypothetical protein